MSFADQIMGKESQTSTTTTTTTTENANNSNNEGGEGTGTTAGEGGAGPDPKDKNTTPAQPAGDNKETKGQGGEGENGEGGTPGPAAPDATPEDSTKAAAAAAEVKPEITDDAVMKYLKEKGISVDSIEQLKPVVQLTPEQEAERKKEFSANATKYSLDNKLFTTETLQKYLVDEQRPAREIALEIFTAAQKAADDSITDEKILERFKELNYELHDEDFWGRGFKSDEMERIKQDYLSAKYGSILGAEQTYQAHLDAQASASDYRKLVESAVAATPDTMSFTIGSKDNAYEVAFKVPADNLKQIQDALLTEHSFGLLGNGKADAKALQDSINSELVRALLPKIMAEVAESYYSQRTIKEKADRHGVKPNRENGSGEGGGKPALTAADAIMQKTSGNK